MFFGTDVESPDREKILKVPLFILTECMNVTDGRTAWRHRPRLCMSSRGQTWRYA